MEGGIGIQTAEAGTGPDCNHKGGASTTPDPNAPYSLNAYVPITPQPTVYQPKISNFIFLIFSSFKLQTVLNLLNWILIFSR
jgi:hypothetical protein